MNKFSKYKEYFKIGFKETIEYKWNIFGAVFEAIFSILFFIFVWFIIYQNLEVEILNGFSFNEVIIYFIIIYSFRLILNYDPVYDFSQKIKSGDITTYLCRPINFIYSITLRGFGNMIMQFLIYIILMIGLIFYFSTNLNTLQIILFFIYSIFVFIFYFLFSIFISLLSFWLVEIWGLHEGIRQLFKIFSGRFFPLTFFPNWLISILIFTPFLYLEYQLTLIFLNKISYYQILFNLSVLFFWILLLIFLIYYFYKKGIKKVSSFGG